MSVMVSDGETVILTYLVIVVVLDQLVEPDVGASPAHPSAAVDQHGAGHGLVHPMGVLNQIQQHRGVLGGLHVRPVLAVKLDNILCHS